MTDDIVTRLRASCDHLCIGCTEENAHDVGLEAADEIERLRAENEYWQERCGRAEDCLAFIYRKRKWWKR